MFCVTGASSAPHHTISCHSQTQEVYDWGLASLGLEESRLPEYDADIDMQIPRAEAPVWPTLDIFASVSSDWTSRTDDATLLDAGLDEVKRLALNDMPLPVDEHIPRSPSDTDGSISSLQTEDALFPMAPISLRRNSISYTGPRQRSASGSSTLAAAHPRQRSASLSSGTPIRRAGSTKRRTLSTSGGSSGSGKVCSCCQATSTPMWREGPDSLRLCNACGIRWQKYGLCCTSCQYIPRKQEKDLTDCPRCDRKFPPAIMTRRRACSMSK